MSLITMFNIMLYCVRLKNINLDLAKQTDLIKLIIEKMEIVREADDDVDEEEEEEKQQNQSIGWSSPALRNSLIKQSSVINAFKKRTLYKD